MSDFHTLDRTDSSINVVFHFPIPNINNRVGVSVRTILATFAKPSCLPTISQAEAAKLANGSLYEVATRFRIHGMDDEKIQQKIERVYDRTRETELRRLKVKYDWWGAEGSVG